MNFICRKMFGLLSKAASRIGSRVVTNQARSMSNIVRNREPLPFDTRKTGKVTLGFILMINTGTVAPYLIVFFQLSKGK